MRDRSRTLLAFTSGFAFLLAAAGAFYVPLLTLAMIMVEREPTAGVVTIWCIYAATVAYAIGGPYSIFRKRRFDRNVGIAWVMGAALPVLAIKVPLILLERYRQGVAVLHAPAERKAHARIVATLKATGEAAHDVARCATRFAATNPSRGYPASLRDAGLAGNDCSSVIAAVERATQYRLVYTPAVAQANGRVPAFTVCAEPAVDGALSTFIDDLGPIPVGAWRVPCRDGGEAQKWRFTHWTARIRRLKYCLLQYAASHPERGYPADTPALQPCTIAEDPQSDDAIEYLPDTPDGSARITSFMLEHRAPCNPEERWGMIGGIADVTAAVHVATDCQRATLTDPLLPADTVSLARPHFKTTAPRCRKRFDAPARVRSSPLPVPKSSLANAGEPVHDGHRYVLTRDGRVVTLHSLRADGSEQWSFPFKVRVSRPPVVGHDGTIYVASPGWLFAVTADGLLKWATPLRDTPGFEPAVGANGGLYVAATGQLYGVDEETGGICWAVPVGGDPRSAPLIEDGFVFANGSAGDTAVFPDARPQ